MSRSLQPAGLDPGREQLIALERRVAEREQALDAFKIELQQLQTRYLSEIGALYADLGRLDAAVAEAEIRAGLRPPPDEVRADHEPAPDDPRAAAGCGNQSAPSDNLKRMFRDLAKKVHPDLARDGPARWRRHSLMAEANRAYAERDEDRLRLILHAWEHSAEAVPGDDPQADALRLRRRKAQLDERLLAIETEFADLHRSAIARLKRRIDETRAQGWDLFAEMRRQVEREISATRARLSKLDRKTAIIG